MSSPSRLLGIVVAGAAALAVAVPGVRGTVAGDDGRLRTTNGDTVALTDDARARAITYAAPVQPADQRWIAAAIARARPEAARLIAEIDGIVQIRTYADAAGETLGLAQSHERGFYVDLNIARLNGDDVGDRDTVVLHELGHVIDFALVPAALNAQLDAGIPHGGPCHQGIDCDAPAERFAETFAKWALNGDVSELSGYGIPMPASIEAWGTPLGRFAYELPAG